ncbi:MAG TPA: acylphosphatase [Candidatus Acidoferrales bacterium]|nr:acylphosphatase [Candidatus Acidoferrales bacterium]
MADAGVHLFVDGVVQGVGYRFFAARQASVYGLKGFVKNLIDGRVEVVAEGEKGLIEEFIKDLRRGPISSHITDIRIEWTSPDYKFEGFEIL